jgi:hypothetical protein
MPRGLLVIRRSATSRHRQLPVQTANRRHPRVDTADRQDTHAKVFALIAVSQMVIPWTALRSGRCRSPSRTTRCMPIHRHDHFAGRPFSAITSMRKSAGCLRSPAATAVTQGPVHADPGDPYEDPERNEVRCRRKPSVTARRPTRFQQRTPPLFPHRLHSAVFYC